MVNDTLQMHCDRPVTMNIEILLGETILIVEALTIRTSLTEFLIIGKDIAFWIKNEGTILTNWKNKYKIDRNRKIKKRKVFFGYICKNLSFFKSSCSSLLHSCYYFAAYTRSFFVCIVCICSL